MYVVDRIEGNYVVLEHDGKILEIEKEKLPEVQEKDILYFIDNSFVKDNNKTNKIKNDIRNRFNKLKG